MRTASQLGPQQCQILGVSYVARSDWARAWIRDKDVVEYADLIALFARVGAGSKSATLGGKIGKPS